MKKLIFIIIPLIAFGFLLAVFYIPGSQETTSASNPDNPGDPSVIDSFTNTNMISSNENLIVDITAGQVKLSDVCYGIADNTQVPGCNGVCQACQSGSCGVVADNTQAPGCNGVCQACQSGACGVANAGTDPGEHCGTTGCLTGNCNGLGICESCTWQGNGLGHCFTTGIGSTSCDPAHNGLSAWGATDKSMNPSGYVGKCMGLYKDVEPGETGSTCFGGVKCVCQ